MIAEWQNAVTDFIPFTARVYYRLVEQHNEALWPWQLAALTAGMAVVVLAAKRHGGVVGAILGTIWIWVGVSFFFPRYGELVWAGNIFGGLFIFQGVVLVASGFFGLLQNPAPGKGVRAAGLLLAIFGLLVWPLFTAARQDGWMLAECFGIFPDPTALTTAGVLLPAARGHWRWLLLPIPILWTLIAGATIWGLRSTL